MGQPRHSRRTLLKRTLLAASAIGLGVLAAGCTAQPLYGPGSAAYSGEALYHIEEVDTRVAQQVRNALIFGLNGGRNPDDAPYRVKLLVTSFAQNLSVEVARQAPTSARVVVNTSFTVRDGTDNIVMTGERSAAASFDRTIQRFANRRSQRDAENRAAKQAAERVRLAVQQVASR